MLGLTDTFNSRHFNDLQVMYDPTDLANRQYVIKSSELKDKIKAEYKWFTHAYYFKSIFTANHVHLPYVKNFVEFEKYSKYNISYINGTTCQNIFLNNDDGTDFDRNYIVEAFAIMFKNFKNLFNDFLSDSSKAVNLTDYKKMLIESMYTVKTLQRLNETSLDLDTPYKINCKSAPSIRELINDSYVEVNKYDISHLIHGDLCFSNMLVPYLGCTSLDNESFTDSCFTYANSNVSLNRTTGFDIVLIDPRGMLTTNECTTIGDIKYDVGKLAHSAIGLYDNIVCDKNFYINKVKDNEYNYYIKLTEMQKRIQDEFKKVFISYERYYYDIMIHMFLSMIPLHKDRPDHQEKFLVNAYRLYFMKHNIIL